MTTILTKTLKYDVSQKGEMFDSLETKKKLPRLAKQRSDITESSRFVDEIMKESQDELLDARDR